MMELLPQLTQEEAQLIYDVLLWDDEKKMAFIMAKRMFEEQMETVD
jgi:hypothetical protein